jgi:ABC-2 type transport system ATP-binding protein
MMTAVEVRDLSYSYARVEALHDLDFAIPEGATYALLGPNGSGKTTLLQILMGLRPVRAGHVSVFGVERRALTRVQRSRIGYVAEGQVLPGWMRLEQLEAYLAPLYPGWDPALARDLRERFSLEPRRRVGTFSRGERMKAALLCALAPRPRLLLMDEPFTGIDVIVKDELVRGLLASSGQEGWTVVIASHDIGELEMLVDWAGILDHGHLRVSEPLDRLRDRYRRITVVTDDAALLEQRPDEGWLSVQRAGRRLSFVAQVRGTDMEALQRARFGAGAHVEVHELSLRELFMALVRGRSPLDREVAA